MSGTSQSHIILYKTFTGHDSKILEGDTHFKMKYWRESGSLAVSSDAIKNYLLTIFNKYGKVYTTKFAHRKENTSMSREDKLKLVKEMDRIVTREFNDERPIMDWLALGCPDESDESDYEWFADNPEEFDNLIKLFVALVSDELNS